MGRRSRPYLVDLGRLRFGRLSHLRWLMLVVRLEHHDGGRGARRSFHPACDFARPWRICPWGRCRDRAGRLATTPRAAQRHEEEQQRHPTDPTRQRCQHRRGSYTVTQVQGRTRRYDNRAHRVRASGDPGLCLIH